MAGCCGSKGQGHSGIVRCIALTSQWGIVGNSSAPDEGVSFSVCLSEEAV